MRAPDHRSVALLALVAILLMSSVMARAAGHDEDVGFLQAVIDGRRDAREAYERVTREERLRAAETSSMRERGELARRPVHEAPDSGPLAGAAAEESAEESPDAPSRFPWISLVLCAAAFVGLCVVRMRAHARAG